MKEVSNYGSEKGVTAKKKCLYEKGTDILDKYIFCSGLQGDTKIPTNHGFSHQILLTAKAVLGNTLLEPRSEERGKIEILLS